MTNEELIREWRRKLPNVEPTDRELSAFALGVETGAALAAPQPEPQPRPCPTCESLARTVMMDQVSYDQKPAAYAIHEITDDDGIEEWVDIWTSPDRAQEDADALMSTGRGERYEVVPLYTHPMQLQPEPVEITDAMVEAALHAWYEGHGYPESDRAEMRVVLEAALGVKK